MQAALTSLHASRRSCEQFSRRMALLGKRPRADLRYIVSKTLLKQTSAIDKRLGVLIDLLREPEDVMKDLDLPVAMDSRPDPDRGNVEAFCDPCCESGGHELQDYRESALLLHSLRRF